MDKDTADAVDDKEESELKNNREEKGVEVEGQAKRTSREEQSPEATRQTSRGREGRRQTENTRTCRQRGRRIKRGEGRRNPRPNRW